MTWILELINEYEGVIGNFIFSIALLIILEGVRRTVLRKVIRNKVDIKEQYNKKKSINGIFIIVDLILLATVWYSWSTYIVTFIGVFSAGLAIAMKDVIINIVGGVYIIWAKPFQIGERIEINGYIGDVVDLGFFQFSMLEVGNRVGGEQSTGRIIQVPNMQIFSTPIENYEKGFRYIWHEIKIELQKESSWEEAKLILQALLEELTQEVTSEAKEQIKDAGKKYLIYYSYLTPIVYTSFEKGGIVLTGRFLCEPRQTRVVENNIWERFLNNIKNIEEICLK
ncbi:MAG: mechanosensitive ion channel [Cellulosilyticaceae bacterium]